ncbi:MAG: thioredoxin-disulfide reductase [Desulfobacteraceae bacterium 4572_130]|nr:MAG: thioredoxin-disulfide reductase [Desulfobacteraceae bacterium 4572_130]
MLETDYDLVIIGAGPAGLTAGIYAARAGINVLLLEMAAPGGQIIVSDLIENYPGFPRGLSGFDLGNKMLKQAENLGVKIETNQVDSIKSLDNKKIIYLNEKTITSKTVIIATGASPRKLHIGEEKFIGKGVSFCATCDAPFFKDKTVVAVGGGDTAVQESIFLTKFARKVYLVHRRDQLRATKILQERAFKNDKIEFIFDSLVTGIDGLFNIENIKIKNIKTNKEKNIQANGCFIWVGIMPNTLFVKDFLELDKKGFIITDKNMKTSVPGVFAAGDVRDTPLRQVSTAIGDGAIATQSAEHFIMALI